MLEQQVLLTPQLSLQAWAQYTFNFTLFVDHINKISS